MSNFAQEYPVLLFLPFIIFAATFAVAGISHLAIAMLGRRPRAARAVPQTAILALPKPNLTEVFNLGVVGFSELPAPRDALAAAKV